MCEVSGELTDTVHYMVVAKFRARLAVINKQHGSFMGKI
jgi:hypothetical protein